MSDDLISRKRLKEAIHTDFAEHFTLYRDSDQTALIDMVMDDIDEAQTAFDKEKVIDKLTWNENALEPGVAKGLLIALEIVEKGGIE